VHYLITAIENPALHRRCILDNPALVDEELQRLSLARIQNESVTELYNSFLESLPDDADGWLIFCSDNLEFTEAPLPRILNSCFSKEALYGVFGARLVKNMRWQYFCEYLGALKPAANTVGTSHLTLYYTLGADFSDNTKVDVLGRQCLILHSDLARQYKLRFDPAFSADFYVEDLCLTARLEQQLISRMLAIDCRVHSRASSPATLHDRLFSPGADNEKSLRQDATRYVEKYALRKIFDNKTMLCAARPDLPALIGNRAAGGDTLEAEAPRKNGGMFPENVLPELRLLAAGGDVYHTNLDYNNHNCTHVLAAGFMRRDAKVLDVGCAWGDLGVFFKDRLNSSMWGVDYDTKSLAQAGLLGIYEELIPADLEHVQLADFNRFYRFFDHIFLGDVLEHLRRPYRILRKFVEFLAPGGTFLASLPNVANGYVLTNLLNGSFDYDCNGILDYTHLRFFTAESQAGMFAECSLLVKRATASFMIPGEYKRWGIPPDLPRSVYEYIFNNRHFLVLQYVCELEKSDLGHDELMDHNLRRLNQAPYNNPKGWEQKKDMYELVKSSLFR
jgi:2-polyprenyl-3-methyl-5-hydroxy-6-metoxy-1,4-benzoquinol methylase